MIKMNGAAIKKTLDIDGVKQNL
ncbi:MAG: hypothetical protein K0R69_2874, partial [Clostridia bacterium]|nr:hypothetical protein [Clostridia bacterium]